MMERNLEDIEVMISHPWVDGFIPLTTWIETGPGPRDFVAPVRARDTHSQKELSISVIPLRYRNNKLSRFLIRIGILQNPWKDSKSESS